MTRHTLSAAAGFAVLSLAACSMPKGSSDPWVGYGPNPPLPKPQKALIPTVDTPKVVGWAQGAAPKAPAGFTVARYADGLDHPRWLYVLPNGDVLVSESASEPSAADKSNQGIKGFFQKMLMKKVGSTKPSPNRIFLLRDSDGDGVAESRMLFAQGLTRPFGMTLVGSTLYVANDNGVVSFPYAPGQTSETGTGQKVFD
ncbi:MAG: L-sorbosone dehydrogenase, partial [Phenylobacterium sp.]|nr:L-sorbosone dehydrogenase [Phenylobacterium sp.]